MPEPTKSCNLSEGEINALIFSHSDNMRMDMERSIERINYLHKRLKAFREPEVMKDQPTPTGAWPTNG